MEHGVKILPKFQESPQNSRREMCDKVPRWRPTNIRGHPTELSLPGDLATGICVLHLRMEECLNLNQRFHCSSSKNLQAFNTQLSLRRHKPRNYHVKWFYLINFRQHVRIKTCICCCVWAHVTSWACKWQHSSWLAVVEFSAGRRIWHPIITASPGCHTIHTLIISSPWFIACSNHCLVVKREVSVCWSLAHHRRNKDVHQESKAGRRTHVYVQDLTAYGGQVVHSFLTPTLDGDKKAVSGCGRFTPMKETLVPIHWEAGWATGKVLALWQKNL